MSTNRPGYFRNGVFHPFEENTQGGIANKWEAMADAAKRERDAMFDQKQLNNRQE